MSNPVAEFYERTCQRPTHVHMRRSDVERMWLEATGYVFVPDESKVLIVWGCRVVFDDSAAEPFARRYGGKS